MRGSLVVGQSGGPTAVINASVAGVFLEALQHEEIDHIYGAYYGIDGIINQKFFEVTKENAKEINNWKTTPAAILGSVRFKLGDFLEDDTIYKKILSVFKEYDIRFFFYIGGNDSMDTCNKLANYFKYVSYDCVVLGIPKTIDNDLVLTDHCPGYGSAAKYVATSLMEVYADTNVYKKGRVTVVEIMGRDAGWLTAATSLASNAGMGPDLIYLPEVAFDIDKFLADVKAFYEKKQKVLIAVSEGIKDKDGKYLLKYRKFNNDDNFGHLQLGGVSLVLAEMVNEHLGYSVRAMEINLLQRCASHLASKADVTEAFKCGKYSVKQALNNKTGKMVAMRRVKDKTTYTLVNLCDVATKVKSFPINWIVNGNNISKEYIEYALPLIKGESHPKFINGLPLYSKINKK